MSTAFDPYHVWLSIPKNEQPPNHYRLLGLPLFEDAPQVIENAADRQMAHLRSVAGGKHAELSQKLLDQIAAAKISLLNPQKKAAYDERLKAEQAARQTPPLRQAQPLKQAEPLAAYAASEQKVLHTRTSQARASQPESQAPVRVQATTAPSQASQVKRQRPFFLQPLVLGAAGLVVVLAISAALLLGRSGEPGKVTVAQRDSDVAEPASIVKSPSDLESEPSPGAAVTQKTASSDVESRPMPDESGEEQTDVGKETLAEEKPVVEKEEPVETKPVAEKEEPTEEKPVVQQPAPPEKPDEGVSNQDQSPPPPSSTEPEVTPQKAEKTTILVPPKDQRDASQKRVQELLADDYKAARSPEEKAALGEKLFGLARETAPENTVDRFVLFEEARQMAAAAGNATLALAAVEALQEQFEFDSWPLKLTTTKDALGNARAAPERKQIVHLALRLADQAQGDDRYDVANDLAQLASTTAARLRENTLREQAVARVKQIRDMKDAWEVAQAALKKLPQDPDDPDANLAVGRYLCFVKGDWPPGLAHLAKGGDAELTALVERELMAPTTIAEQLKLADDWWAWIETGSRSSRDVYRPLAHYWYTRVQSELSGLEKAHVEKQLAKIGEVARPRGGSAGEAAPAAVTDARELDDGKLPKLVQLRQWPAEGCPDVGFIPGGRYGLSCQTHYAYVRDLVTGKDVQKLPGPTPYLAIMVVSPNGRRVIRGFRRGEGVVVSDVATGQVTHHFTGHEKADWMFSSLDVSADSTQGLSAGRDNTLRLWELETGKELLKLDSSPAIVRFLPDGRFLSAVQNAIHIWNSKTGQEVQTLPDHSSNIASVAVAADGNNLAVGLAGGEIWLWQLEPQRIVRRIITPEIADADYWPDGRRLISCGGGKLAVWEVATGKKLAMAEQPKVARVAVSPDGKHVLSGSGGESGTILWQLP